MQSPYQAPGNLDDEQYARFAWARFWRIQRWMAVVAVCVAALVLALLWWTSGPMPWLFVALVVVGIVATVLMATALMGLMFLSSGTGHDNDVIDPLAGSAQLDD